MKKILFYFLSVSLFILTSCSNDNSDNDQDTNSVLPKAIKFINETDLSKSDITTISYDGNKIVNVLSENEKIAYTYEGDKIVNEVKYYLENGKEKMYCNLLYTYENNRLKTVETVVYGEDIRYVYIYNSDGTVTIETYNLDKKSAKELKKTENKVLTFINGNLSKSVSNWGDSYDDVVTTCRYDYDTNNSAFKNVLGLSLLLDQANFGSELNISCTNNIKKVNAYSRQGPSSDIQFEPHLNTMEYKYNKKGYPIKKTTTDYTGKIIEIIEYIY